VFEWPLLWENWVCWRSFCLPNVKEITWRSRRGLHVIFLLGLKPSMVVSTLATLAPFTRSNYAIIFVLYQHAHCISINEFYFDDSITVSCTWVFWLFCREDALSMWKIFTTTRLKTIWTTNFLNPPSLKATKKHAAKGYFLMDPASSRRVDQFKPFFEACHWNFADFGDLFKPYPWGNCGNGRNISDRQQDGMTKTLISLVINQIDEETSNKLMG